MKHFYCKTRPASVTLAVLLALSMALAACSSPAGDSGSAASASAASAPSADAASAAVRPAGAYTFTDDLGYEVTVQSADKVVACMGSFARIWELAGGELAGVSDDALADYGVSSPNVATVGDFSAPDLERIIALEPDLVLMTGAAATGRAGSASQTDLRQALVDSDIPVAYFSVTVFDDYLRMLRTCCDITGREDLYQQNGADVAERIGQIKADAAAKAAEGAPTVLMMTTYSGGTRVQGASTQNGAMLADLGAQNLADANPSLLADFSLEAVIEANPDFIFVVPMGNDDAAALENLEQATAANPAWATLDAVANGNYIILDKGMYLYKPNEKWADAYQQLYDYLY